MVDEGESEELDICVMGHEMSGRMFIWYFLFYEHFLSAVPFEEEVDVEP